MNTMSRKIKFGYCINMSATDEDILGIQTLSALKTAGLDYAEIPLAEVMQLGDSEFKDVLKRISESGIQCEVCNNFFPAHIRLTGAYTSKEQIDHYVDKALSRANALGAKVIVFGSSGARNVETGFPMDKAHEQLVDVLKLISRKAHPYDICIAIESLSKKESNIINALSDGAELAKIVGCHNIGNLIDVYHMEMEGENAEIIKTLHSEGARFFHAHIADKATGRGFPLDKAKFESFAEALIDIGYSGRLSIEGYSDDLSGELLIAKKVLENLF
jgi:sugar phosphate isomerase/epimerase